MSWLAPSEIDGLHAIAPNFKKRLSGVTSTIRQLIPAQRRLGYRIAATGPGLPDTLPQVRLTGFWRFWKKPDGVPVRIWHARRNTEMVGGLILRDVLRMPVKIVFTSASQRHHKWFTRWLIARMDHVIATSAKTASYLKVPSTVILHGIDTERFAPAEDKAAAKSAKGLDPALSYIGCFGRVRHQKGTDLFIDAVMPVLRDHPGWAAVIAGRATAEHQAYEQALKDKVRAEGLAERLLFVGEHTDIDALYKTLDLFVAPQRWEGFGLTPLEAQASGVPVVATDVGAFSEIIPEGKSGTVLKTLEAREMEAAIRTFVSDDALLARASDAARAHALENFAIDREANDIIAVYKAVANGDARP